MMSTHDEAPHMGPQDIRDEIALLDTESAGVLADIRGLL